MNKPIKPNITIPESFAENGVKTDFDDTLLADGFDNLRPDVLAGDNLNKFIDDTYKGLNYSMAAADAINLINEGETLTVKDGKLSSGSVGEGLVKILVPTGTVISSAISSTPTGYLLCNGSAVSRTAYADLFSAIGTTYGTGDGSTTFNLPNYSTYKFVTSTTVGVKGTGKTLGFNDGSQNFGLVGSFATNTRFALASPSVYNKNVGTTMTSNNYLSNQMKSIGIVTSDSNSGLTGTVSTATLKWYIKY